MIFTSVVVVKNTYLNDGLSINQKHKQMTETRICHYIKKMRELGVENFYIELIENYPCESQ